MKIDREQRTTINLPPLPHSWHALSAAECEEVHQLLIRRSMAIAGGQDPEQADMLFKYHCFALFTGLKPLTIDLHDAQGERVYIFRRRGLKHILERIPIHAADIVEWCRTRLAWLDRIDTLIVCPYKTMKLHGTLFKAPDTLMADVTKLQYFTLQTLLQNVRQLTALLQHQVDDEHTSMEAVRRTTQQLNEAKAKFVAAMLTPASHEVETRTGHSVRRTDRIIHVFEMDQLRHYSLFMGWRTERMFPVLVQFFHSVQQNYAQKWPHLFTEREDANGNTDYLLMEVSLMNTIMEQSNFTDFDEINRTNVVFIFEMLERMSRKAEEIERMNKQHR